MPTDRLQHKLTHWLNERAASGALKGSERVIADVVPSIAGKGPRFLLDGLEDREFIRMNANDYLGLAFHPAVRRADDNAVKQFGTGPGAVRFISGTWRAHRTLEDRLAAFHHREAAMIFNSAYTAVMSVIPALVDSETAVLSDELNHNSIINATRLAQPQYKFVYPHLDMAAMEQTLKRAASTCSSAIIVTDGVFSMRGDHAPLDRIMAIARRHDENFRGNVIVIADDSHGVGAYGETGRGTEEVCDGEPVDLLISTLGKAIGVNGGYVAASSTIIRYLREVSPFYIYSNPISQAEAAAANAAVNLIDSAIGTQRLAHLKSMTQRFKHGLTALGFETVPGEHPVVAMLVRDASRARVIVDHLMVNNILATALSYPVVPAGEDEIRFQLCADHTAGDIDQVLTALASA